MKALSLFVTALLLFAISTLVQATTFASGEKQVSLVELYTSEGCSSCPPADRWLTSLTGHPKLWQDFVPVAFHVDYWNYLGWQDPFAQAKFSARQRNYRRQRGIASVYTPGFVSNGSEWRGWFNRAREIPLSTRTPGELVLKLNDQAFSASFSSKHDDWHDLKLNIAVLAMGVTSEVARGENSGRTLNHDFVVTHYQQVDAQDDWQWQGVLPKPRLPIVNSAGDTSYAIAAWLTQGSQQLPIQALGGYLDYDS